MVAMNITWLGMSCVKLEEQTRDFEASIVLDPFESSGKVKLPRSLKTDIVVSSIDIPAYNDFDAVIDPKFKITGAGEYEIKDIFVTGFEVERAGFKGREAKGTVWSIMIGGIRVVDVSAATVPLPDKVLEQMANIDVLIVPVGGDLKAKIAHEIVEQIEPRVVIPINFRTSNIGEELDGPEAFIKLMAVSKPEPTAKFKILPKDVPQDEMKLVILEV